MHRKALIPNVLFLLVVVGFFFAPREVQSQSKLTIKSVDVVPKANYSSLKGGSSPQKLIDGRLAGTNLFWLDPNALGWQNHGQITIDLEISSPALVTGVKLTTAKNEAAEILLPLNVHAFGSIDGKGYAYLGDLNANKQDHPDGYLTVELSRQGIDKNARYVRLIIIPHGRMFFTDEITVYGKKVVTNANTRMKTLSPQEVEEIIRESKRSEINRSSLLQELKTLKGKIKAADYNAVRRTILNTTSFETDDAYNVVSRRIADMGAPGDRKAGVHLRYLASPWGDLQTGMSGPNQSVSLRNAVNTTQYLTFEVVNNTGKPLKILNFKSPALVRTTLYEIQSVKARNATSVQDVMFPVPLRPGAPLMEPGQKKKYILAIESLKAGNADISIAFSIPGSLPLNVRVQSADIGLNDTFTRKNKLNVNVWPYFTFPFYKNREELIRHDLINHYSNTFAIPAWTLEPLNLTTDFKKLKDYLKYYRKGDRVILFMNHRPYMDNPGDYLKASWNKRFLSWYDSMIAVLDKHGIGNDQVYLYPFDEIQEREVNSFNTFASWIKKERGAQLFITLVHQKMLPRVIKNSDIYQILITKNDINRIGQSPGKSFWIYDIMDNSKQTDPYTRYRLLSWKAFLAGAKGIGFWNYAEMFGASVWDDFDGKKADYNTVYDHGKVIVPSRRWEAFKQGIEDHLILMRYAEKAGHSRARKLAEDVLKASGQSHKADEARAIALRVLSN